MKNFSHVLKFVFKKRHREFHGNIYIYTKPFVLHLKARHIKIKDYERKTYLPSKYFVLYPVRKIFLSIFFQEI
jgi:hypothetical protein